MTVPFRTFALFGLALGMLAAGYLFAPAPGASRPLPTQPLAKAAAPAPTKAAAAPTLAANRPPVPLVTQPRSTYFTPPPEQAAADPAASAAAKQPGDTTQALAVSAPGEDSGAKRAIEFDGYRNVRGLTKGADGVWHGRAMRGRTEIAVRVDASGSVSAE
jgi:hypothetical protein